MKPIGKRNKEMKNKIDTGNSYSIIENGKRLTGIIGEKVGNKYKVKWSDGTETIEDLNKNKK